MKSYCLQHTGQKLPWSNKKQELQNFLVDDNFTFIYCAVPKVASTWNVESGFIESEKYLKSVSGSPCWTLETLSEYNPTDLSNRTAMHFKFLFVREPFHRLLSSYKDKFLKSENKDYYKEHRRVILKAFRPQDVKRWLTGTAIMLLSLNFLMSFYRNVTLLLVIRNGSKYKSSAIHMLSILILSAILKLWGRTLHTFWLNSNLITAWPFGWVIQHIPPVI